MNQRHEDMKLAAKKIAKERGTSYKLSTSRENPDDYTLIFGDGYEPSAEEIATETAAAIIENNWVEVRLKRNALLLKTDWTQALDSPLTSAQKTLWRDYRQSLRDITDQEDPSNISWPDEPV